MMKLFSKAKPTLESTSPTCCRAPSL